MALAKPPLPECALRFMDEAPATGHPIVLRLHRWMRLQYIGIKQLSPTDVQRFLDQPKLTEATRREYLRQLLRYLEWLFGRGLLPWDPDPFRKHPKRLARHGETFLADIAVTVEPSTLNGYRTSLRKLARWLHDAGFELTKLTRPQLSLWLRHLAHQGLHPSTRRSIINHTRAFFYWLAEHQHIEAHPDDLLRSSDLPKLPEYLPRPLPVDIDTELQRRLAASSKRHDMGLLLMRQTGLRIGELVRLDYDCVYADPAGYRALKVPLGKLKTERLVPITDDIHALILRIRRNGRCPRRWLIDRNTRHPAVQQALVDALRQASKGLRDEKPITSHRLRHTYATSLLAGGMSLLGIMKLLGHRDHRMTLRYTAITQADVRREYLRALDSIRTRYTLPSPTLDRPPRDEVRPSKLIHHAIRWLQTHAASDSSTPSILKRLQRIEAALRRTERAAESREKSREK